MGRSSLERFHRAQASGPASVESALAELRTTGKRGHWIWYVFPQLAGLGKSPESREYGIDGLGEATKYVRDPLLCARLLAVTKAVAERLREGKRVSTVMGSEIDALKLVSSLTLFEEVARRAVLDGASDDCRAFASLASEVLTIAEAQGYPRCTFTLERLNSLSTQRRSR